MEQTNQSDEKLATASLKDKRSFDILVERYTDRIWRYTSRLTGNHREAEDITQETFLKAFVNIAGFNPKLKFSSWLYRIAHNESVNFIKKHYRHRKVAFDETVLYTSSGEKTMFDKLIVQDDIRLARHALAHLASRDRAILELAFFEDKSYLEIADILKIAVNSVGPSIHRAKGKMKKICEEIK
jgi:RNA polymerase sigma-70 factor (ECF subfamily)